MEDERHIWQRVMAPPEEKGTPCRELLVRCLELAAAYSRMASGLAGRQRALAMKLAQGEQANAACLRGIAALSGHPGEQVKVWVPGGRETPESCYRRTRQCLAEYMARSLDPEFGEVYRQLARREGEHCAWIAEWMGLV